MTEFDRVRGSSKAFILLTLFVFVFYKFVVMLRLIKTKGDQEVTFPTHILLGGGNNPRLHGDLQASF